MAAMFAAGIDLEEARQHLIANVGKTGSGPYTLELKQRVPEFFIDLKTDKRAEMFLVPKRASEPVGRIDLVLHVPAVVSSARMQRQGEGMGRPMTYAELSKYEAEPGFRSIGWCGENVPAGIKFVAEVVI